MPGSERWRDILLKIGFATLVLAVLGVLGQASQINPIFGVWRTPSNDGRVVVLRCGQFVCAHILDAAPLRANPDQRDIYNPDPAMRGRRVKNLFVLEGYEGGPYEWRGGSIYDPQTGYESADTSLRFIPPETLIVKGCRQASCRVETWTKLSPAQLSSTGDD